MLSNDEVVAARERLGPVGVWMGSLMGATIERGARDRPAHRGAGLRLHLDR